MCCGDKLALLHHNGRLMSNGYEPRAQHNTAPQVVQCSSIPPVQRERYRKARQVRDTRQHQACPLERGRVALAVTRSEKVGAAGGEGLSQAA